jgi:hypothetical protein
VHADAARLTALQDDVAALGAFHLFDKNSVALPQVRGDMFALSLEKTLFRAEWLAVLPFF